MKKLIVSAIVPVFNEDKTIGKIVNVLLKSPLINEVICVNDGSTDKTYSILKSFKKEIKLINFKKNRGKGFALSKGIENANGELVMFVDGDLKNFYSVHIKTLLSPVTDKKYKGVMGVPLRNKRNLRNDIAVYFLDKYVTGERVYFRKHLLPHLPRIAKTGYGVEVFLNSLFKKNQIKVVHLKGLISPSKEHKWGIQKALKSYAIAGTDITQELGKQMVKNGLNKKINRKFVKKITKNLNKAVRKIKDFDVERIISPYNI
ncbi:MAG: glycosyltransferase family 2 protein [Candidatus Levybacteria bacterium]|nr:glycosyltransferase family 2 protein [Candidatus Levybacteria bacterium]